MVLYYFPLDFTICLPSYSNLLILSPCPLAFWSSGYIRVFRPNLVWWSFWRFLDKKTNFLRPGYTRKGLLRNYPNGSSICHVLINHLHFFRTLPSTHGFISLITCSKVLINHSPWFSHIAPYTCFYITHHMFKSVNLSFALVFEHSPVHMLLYHSSYVQKWDAGLLPSWYDEIFLAIWQWERWWRYGDIHSDILLQARTRLCYSANCSLAHLGKNLLGNFLYYNREINCPSEMEWKFTDHKFQLSRANHPKHSVFLRTAVSHTATKIAFMYSFSGTRSQFLHSCVCERFVYSQVRPTYFLQQNRQTDPGNI